MSKVVVINDGVSLPGQDNAGLHPTPLNILGV